MRFLKGITIACVLTAAAGVALVAYREHVLNTHDIVAPEFWPRELRSLTSESAARGDPISDVEVRSVGLVTTYVWRMPEHGNRLDLHLKQFTLAAVSPDGMEQKRILSRWPDAWDLPTANFEMYASPVGLPGAQDGEHEFVLLHDKGTETIYFYYYFNF